MVTLGASVVDRLSLQLTLVLFLSVVVVTLFTALLTAPQRDEIGEFYLGNRVMSPLRNGLAMCGDYLSAATLLGSTGLVALTGYGQARDRGEHRAEDDRGVQRGQGTGEADDAQQGGHPISLGGACTSAHVLLLSPYPQVSPLSCRFGRCRATPSDWSMSALPNWSTACGTATIGVPVASPSWLPPAPAWVMKASACFSTDSCGTQGCTSMFGGTCPRSAGSTCAPIWSTTCQPGRPPKASTHSR